jgi:hypothetical protein
MMRLERANWLPKSAVMHQESVANQRLRSVCTAEFAAFMRIFSKFPSTSAHGSYTVDNSKNKIKANKTNCSIRFKGPKWRRGEVQLTPNEASIDIS